MQLPLQRRLRIFFDNLRVTSDQPVVVGANFQFNGNLPSQCSLLPK